MICKQCSSEFKPNHAKYQDYCNWDCYKLSFKKPDRYCQECNIILTVRHKIKFCSKSCAASFNNKHKTTGTRRSKLEQYIEENLSKELPEEPVLFNNKEVIGSELDIYFPRLKIAFEINGVFHYKPIYGEEKLKRTQAMDKFKREVCKEKGIKLFEIDTSSQLQFSEASSEKFIKEIIKEVL